MVAMYAREDSLLSSRSYVVLDYSPWRASGRSTEDGEKRVNIHDDRGYRTACYYIMTMTMTKI
jgi:hypothetical protein